MRVLFMNLKRSEFTPLLLHVPPDSDLGKLREHVYLLNRLTKLLQKIFPENWQSQLKVISIRNNLVIVEVDSLKLISLVSLKKKEIIKSFKSVDNELNTLDVVLKSSAKNSLSVLQERVISENSAQLLEWVAGISPPGLKDALIKLANHKS